MPQPKKTRRPIEKKQGNEIQKATASAKSKELHPNAQFRSNAAHLLLPQRTKTTSLKECDN